MRRPKGVSWTDHTFNGWIGCTKISPGCTHCYAETIATRHWKTAWGPKGTRKLNREAYWQQPARWNRRAAREHTPRLVFSGSMCDVFEDHPVAEATRPRLWKIIKETPHLTWLLLTKRPERIADHLPPGWPWPHVWLGTSIETQAYRWRAKALRDIPAEHRFLSLEPLLEDLDTLDLTGIAWAIVGGESGPQHRPMDVSWVASIARQCVSAQVPLFIKQDAATREGQRGRLSAELWAYDWTPGDGA